MANDEEEMKQEQTAETAKAEEGNKATEQNTLEEPQKTEEEEKFTQSQINEIVTRRLAKQAESFYKKYGVNDEEGLNALVGKAKEYDTLNKKYDELSGKNEELNEKYLFNTNSIKKDREDDVRTYFKGKELQFTDENIKEALKTHAEWASTPVSNPLPVGNSGTPKVEEDEIDIASRLFGINLRGKK